MNEQQGEINEWKWVIKHVDVYLDEWKGTNEKEKSRWYKEQKTKDFIKYETAYELRFSVAIS